MNIINNYKIFESRSEIEEFCFKNIRNYVINKDNSVNVNGSVYIDSRKLIEIPCKFNEVTGDFYCNRNRLANTKKLPKIIGGVISCEDNNFPIEIKYFTDNYSKKDNHQEVIKQILYWQDDYSIWNSDNTINKFRLAQLFLDCFNTELLFNGMKVNHIKYGEGIATYVGYHGILEVQNDIVASESPVITVKFDKREIGERRMYYSHNFFIKD